MKISYLSFSLGLILFIIAGVKAQNRSADVFVGQNRTRIADDKLYIDFDIDISKLDIRSNQGIVLIPVLQFETESKNLPEVIINGRGRDISYLRAIRHKNRMSSENKPYAVIRMGNKSQAVIEYRVEMPFEVWMGNSRILLHGNLFTCDRTSVRILNQVVSHDIGQPHIFVPLLTYVSQNPVVTESLRDSVCSVLLFPVGSATILSDYAQNKQNIARAAVILTNPNITITGIDIVGSASPEGSYRLNEQLSEERAKKLASFFVKNYNVLTELNNVTWGGEDWTSLIKMVGQSDMEYKDQVIKIIKGNSAPSGRQYDLIHLREGEPYRYMQEHFFPVLRHAAYRIHYQSAPFNIVQGRALLLSDSKTLTENEMLLVAESYPHDSAEYNQAIFIAAKTYPDNLTISINASAAALSEGDTAAAKKYLERFEQWSESWNNLGVIYWLEGNKELAVEYFQYAAANGSIEASDNLEKINVK